MLVNQERRKLTKKREIIERRISRLLNPLPDEPKRVALAATSLSEQLRLINDLSDPNLHLNRAIVAWFTTLTQSGGLIPVINLGVDVEMLILSYGVSFLSFAEEAEHRTDFQTAFGFVPPLLLFLSA